MDMSGVAWILKVLFTCPERESQLKPRTQFRLRTDGAASASILAGDASAATETADKSNKNFRRVDTN